jgi:hypothetical protein
MLAAVEVETRENRESMCGDCQVEHECQVRHFIQHLGGAVGRCIISALVARFEEACVGGER